MKDAGFDDLMIRLEMTRIRKAEAARLLGAATERFSALSAELAAFSGDQSYDIQAIENVRGRREDAAKRLRELHVVLASLRTRERRLVRTARLIKDGWPALRIAAGFLLSIVLWRRH